MLASGSQLKEAMPFPLEGQLFQMKKDEFTLFHSVLWHWWLGGRKDIRPVKAHST